MNCLSYIRKNFKLIFTTTLILTLLVNINLISSNGDFGDRSKNEYYNFQFQSDSILTKGDIYNESTTGEAYSVYVSGDYAYVADGLSGLAVIDISDPTNPGTPVYEDTTGYAQGVYVSGDYAYLADGNSG